jgi:acetyltransferase-like isoleucine patch superfamily enzyme
MAAKLGGESGVDSVAAIQRGAEIGAVCKISNHPVSCEGVIGDGVFTGHRVVLINDRRYWAVTVTNPC